MTVSTITSITHHICNHTANHDRKIAVGSPSWSVLLAISCSRPYLQCPQVYTPAWNETPADLFQQLAYLYLPRIVLVQWYKVSSTITILSISL